MATPEGQQKTIFSKAKMKNRQKLRWGLSDGVCRLNLNSINQLTNKYKKFLKKSMLSKSEKRPKIL
jgi:hypothetical protein